MHRIVRRRFAGAMAATLAATWARAGSAAPVYTMRLSITTAPTSVYGIVCTRFAQAVERRTNGQISIEVYPNSQLAKQADTLDGIVSGVIDFTTTALSFLEPAFPRLQVLDLPFLFKDFPSAYRVLDGGIGDEFAAELESKGIVNLGWGDGGFKELETTRPVSNLDDMKGLRVRIQGGAIFTATYQALGALPVVIEVAETYVALQQHVVDGLDIGLSTFAASKFWNLAKHMAMTNHAFSVQPLIASKRKVAALPVPLQRIIREEGKATIQFWRSYAAKQLADDTQALKNDGVTFTEIPFAAFRKAVDPVYATFRSRPGGEFIDRIARASG